MQHPIPPPSHDSLLLRLLLIPGPGDLRQRIEADEGVVEDLPFESFEACVCLSVPAEALSQWSHKFTSDQFSRSMLSLVPGSLLSAMRPSSFGQILLPKLWLDGNLMISPACIVRAYLINSPLEFTREVSSKMSFRPLGDSSGGHTTRTDAFPNMSSPSCFCRWRDGIYWASVELASSH